MSGKNTLAEGVSPRVGFPPTQSGVTGAPGVPIPVPPINTTEELALRQAKKNNEYNNSTWRPLMRNMKSAVKARNNRLRKAEMKNAYNSTLSNMRSSGATNSNFTLRPKWTAGPKPGTNMNRNLSRRSLLLRGREYKPNPHVMLDPSYEKPFYSNMWLDDAHTNAARVFGNKPENILNRYKYERGFRNQEATRAAWEQRQQQHRNATAQAASRKAAEEEAIRKGDEYLTAKIQQQSLEEQQRKLARNIKAARNLKQTLKSNYRAADSVLKPKKWYEFWKGGKSRKSRKSHKSRKSRKSHKGRKSRRNAACK